MGQGGSLERAYSRPKIIWLDFILFLCNSILFFLVEPLVRVLPVLCMGTILVFCLAKGNVEWHHWI